MALPRPQDRGPWTHPDYEANRRRIEKMADRRTWERLGRRFGLRGGELEGLLTRFLDERIAAALRSPTNPILEQLRDPDQADAWRSPLVDLLIDDLTQLVTLLTTKEKKHDPRTSRKS